jgi:hypothetical protein
MADRKPVNISLDLFLRPISPGVGEGKIEVVSIAYV